MQYNREQNTVKLVKTKESSAQALFHLWFRTARTTNAHQKKWRRIHFPVLLTGEFQICQRDTLKSSGN